MKKQNRLSNFTCFLISLCACLIVFAPGECLAVRKNFRVKVVGVCDGSVNNLRAGPEQVANIADGTACTAKLTYTRGSGDSQVPLAGKQIIIQKYTQTAVEDLDEGTTNSSGIIQFEFPWDNEACYYRVATANSSKVKFIKTLIWDSSDCFCAGGDCGV